MSPLQTELPRLLALPDGIEEQFWSQPSVEYSVLLWDKIGLLMGFSMHALLDVQGVSWYSHGKPHIHIAPALQILQLLWATVHSDSYMRRRRTFTLVQRVRWFVVTTLLQAYVPNETFMASFLAVSVSSSLDAWLVLLQLMAFFATPAIFVWLVHGLPFRLQLGAAALQVFQHAVYSVPHQQRVIEQLHLQPQLSRFCSTMSVALDPSTSSTLQPPPTWCNSPGFHAWLLVYLHVVVACIIPLHLIHTAEYNSKVRFLCSLEGAAAGGSRQLRPRIKSWSLCLMQCCASCSIGWCLIIVVYASLSALSGQLPLY
jgi:hypothetical protein